MEASIVGRSDLDFQFVTFPWVTGLRCPIVKFQIVFFFICVFVFAFVFFSLHVCPPNVLYVKFTFYFCVWTRKDTSASLEPFSIQMHEQW